MAAVMADCRRQEIDDDEIGGSCGKDGLVEAMIVAAPYHGGDGSGGRWCNLDLGRGIRSPSLPSSSSLSLATVAVAAALTTAIVNGVRRDSEISRGGGGGGWRQFAGRIHRCRWWQR